METEDHYQGALAVLAGQWSKLKVTVSGSLTVSKPSMTAK